MSRRICIALLALMAPVFGAEPGARSIDLESDGVIPQIATGGGAFFMDFQFVNSSNFASTVTVSFYDSDGVPMIVPYVQDGVEDQGTTLVATVQPNGIEFARTILDAPDVQIGWAEYDSTFLGVVSVQATFNQVVEDRPLFQAYIPADTTDKPAFFLPSINTGGQTSNLAVVSRVAQNVMYIARDTNGVELCNAGRPFLAGEHRAFTIPQMLPCLAGVNGIVEVKGDDGQQLFGVGITAQDDGAFVTQPPVPERLILF